MAGFRSLVLPPSDSMTPCLLRLLNRATGCILFAACAPKAVEITGGGPTEQSWQCGGFTVRFVAGPDQPPGEKPRTFSFYQVTRRSEKHPVTLDLGVESAMDVWHFRNTPGSRPSEFIKLFASPSGKTLLIEEDVPNDCSPCWNHMLVRFDGEEMTATYLDLPSRVTKDTEVFGFTPLATSISDHDISYRYNDGTTVTERFEKRIKPDQHPTPPG